MKSKRIQLGQIYTAIDVPYRFVGNCFYCGEPADTEDHVPPVTRYHDYIGIYDRHRPLTVPACRECNGLLSDSLQKDVFDRFDECKVKLSMELSKILKYGKLWDEDGVEYAQFTGNFQTFGEGVQQLATIAKERLDWKHWPVAFDGVDLLKPDEEGIKVEGKTFKSVDHILEYGKRAYGIPQKYLEEVIGIVGLSRSEYAIRICTLSPVKTTQQMNQVLRDIREAEVNTCKT